MSKKTLILNTVTALMNGTMALSPFTWIALAISGVVVAGVALYKNWDKITAFADKLWTKLKFVWEGIKIGFTDSFKFIKGMFFGYINEIIGGLNKLIAGANNIKFDAPDWVPKIGGKSFGINIPMIPTFAKGGIANQPSIFGEAGPEMAIPLKRTPRSLMLLEKTAGLLGVKRNADKPASFAQSLFKLPALNQLVGTEIPVIDGRRPAQTNNSNEVHVHVHFHVGEGTDQQGLRSLVPQIEPAVRSALAKAGLDRRRTSFGNPQIV